MVYGVNDICYNVLEERAEKQNHELEAEYSTKYSKYLYQLEKNRSANFYITWLYVCLLYTSDAADE